MRAALSFPVLLALAVAAAAGEHGGKEAPPIAPIAGPATPLSDMMLDVQRLQARMAKGDKAAYGDQRTRMKAVGAAILAAGAEAFKVKAEREAVVVYLLSGGQPRDVAKIVERGDFPEAERDLLRGASGYASGREADADALLPYDPKTESLRLGSQLAYAQSVLLTPKDARKAIDLLDLARLLAPGTLIEEAALRREILLVGDLRDAERVGFLARQYVERFGASIYAGDFVRTLATAAIRDDLCATLADLSKFTALLKLAPPEQARAFLLQVSRASILLGRFDVASEAAREALVSAARGSSDEQRARLYDLLARFPQMSDVDMNAALAETGIDKLTAADRDLFNAAASMRERLHEPPPQSQLDDIWREIAVATARSPDMQQAGADPAAATVRRGYAALSAGEALEGKDDLR